MSVMLNSIGNAARRFWRREDGNSTIEFVLALPLTMTLFVAGLESGLLETRHVMLERGLDVTVRKVRIGEIAVPTHDLLKEEICFYAKIIPDCINQVQLEMVRNDMRDWQNVSADPDCVDREEEGVPLINFNTGGNNELMILRACALFDPLLPTSTMGAAIPKENGGAYALVASSSFVLEPFQ